MSGYHGNRDHLKVWQARMKARGWNISADGLYGPRTRAVARAFQREKHLPVDGLIGKATWDAAWDARVT
ncbi:peptidoglycan-binding domain-containing protein [Brevibacterium sp. UMB1308A]|uniref:peptidoglycan-binding domain-containing protein n=1 Tax=Brevibacterium sp. UMB1308A TaxID=3050608 RepID=UPI00254EE2C1|nr:peptidoglycan-binding domain-containing protein [Brevibacterium sp. UMB1308A]MDK8345415.1 peptidoglycan-binding domain-containing protein [Brevibacterium sp. UMB1308B]MDK8712738.1 peptidoglycan-binding domain-containing protein [Brevibacterium sp. UMB1308A]